MNILLIIEGTYPWYRGGVSEWVFQYLQHMPYIRFSILQIATDEFQGMDPSEALYPLTDNIVDFTRISPPVMSGEHREYLDKWLQQIELSTRDTYESFDAIHVTNTGFAGWLGGCLSKQMDVPMLLTEHAIYWKEVKMGAVALECGYKIPESISAKEHTVEVFKELASFTYQHATQIVTVSESNIPFQRQLGAESIQYIPNGIPRNWLVHEKKRNHQPVVAWVGRCAEMKNPLAFFDFVEEFSDLDIQPVYKMLLCSANEPALEEKVKQKAALFPEIECIWNESAKEYFNDFDFLSITSHNESQPLVMLEALANRALPVGFKVGDLTEKYGLVEEKQSSLSALAENIATLWANQSAFEEFVSDRFEKVKNEHTWDNIFGRYEQLLLEMIRQEAVSA